MPLAITQTATAIAPRTTASFFARGGTAPYAYTVLPGGAGGTINAVTGRYYAPADFSSEPQKMYDVIEAVDYNGDTARARIMVGSALMLFCEVIQRGMGLADGRVYLWDQKLMQPTDSGLYVAVSVPIITPFGSSNRFNGALGVSEQYVTVRADADVNLISRGPEARDRKEDLILALDSDYARRQQDANAFYISKLDRRFVNLSQLDGAAIPYRYAASVRIQYTYSKTRPTEFFDDFEGPDLHFND